MLERAFAEACATQGIVPGITDYAHYMVAVHQTLGEPAVDVFRGLFPGNPGRAEAAALSFERSFRAAIDRHGLTAVPGARGAAGVRCPDLHDHRAVPAPAWHRARHARLVAAGRPRAVPGGRAQGLP